MFVRPEEEPPAPAPESAAPQEQANGIREDDPYAVVKLLGSVVELLAFLAQEQQETNKLLREVVELLAEPDACEKCGADLSELDDSATKCPGCGVELEADG